MHHKWKSLLLVALLVPCWVVAMRYDIDLVNLHAVAKFLHIDITRVYAQNGSLGRWFYGPFSLVLIKPLGLLSYNEAKGLWIVLQTISYLFFWIFLYRLYPFLKSATWAWLIVWVAAINPIHNNYQSNNIQLMLAAVLLGAEVMTQSKSKTTLFWAGAIVSLAASVKMFPFFIAAFYLIVKPQPVRLGVVLGLIGAHLFPFLVFGVDDSLLLYRDFISNLLTYGEQNKTPDILCLPTLVSRTFPDASAWLNKVLLFGISALFFGWVWVKRKVAGSSVHYYALASALMAFLNPSTRPHYFIFYVPAFASLMCVTNRKIVPATLTAWALITLTAEGVVGHDLNERLEWASIPTFGMLLLCLLLTWTLRQINDVGDGDVVNARA